MADVGAVSLGSLVAQALGVVIDLALFRVVSVAFGLLLGLDLFLILFKFSVIQSGSIGKYYSHCLYSLPPPANLLWFQAPGMADFLLETMPDTHDLEARFSDHPVTAITRSPDLSRLAVDQKNLFGSLDPKI